MLGRIINIARFCTDDGPGIRTTVFLKGCPLRCIWCHNPESQNCGIETATTGEVFGKDVSAQDVFREIEKDRVFYEQSGGGATVSGGEPLLQYRFTAEILRLCRENGIRTAIETCGYADGDALDSVIPFCDLVLFDVKETDDGRHMRYTGVSFEKILRSLELIDRAGVPTVIRLPVVPGLNDREDHFRKAAEIIRSLDHCRGYEIMPYHTLGKYKYGQLGRPYLCEETKEPDRDRKASWKACLDSFVRKS